MTEQQRTIELLKSGDAGTIRRVYSDNRSRCLAFLQSRGLSPAQAEDVYQDVIIALVENARKGKLDQLQSALSTYLFAIAKFMAYRVLRHDRRMSSLADVTALEAEVAAQEADIEWLDVDDMAEDPAVKDLRRHLDQLGPRCREILRMAFYEGKSADEIAAELGYPGKDVLKSTKSRCLRQLRELFNAKKYG